MKNFKVKDLMISVHPHVYDDKGYMGAGAMEAACFAVSKCSATKPDCMAVSKCGATKPHPTCMAVSNCGATKPTHYEGKHDQQSAYSSDLMNLKQALSSMQANKMSL